jgi:hypothetical protein
VGGGGGVQGKGAGKGGTGAHTRGGLGLVQPSGAPKAARSGSGRAEPYSASVMSPSSATIGLCTCIGEAATRIGKARAEAEGWAARESRSGFALAGSG